MKTFNILAIAALAYTAAADKMKARCKLADSTGTEVGNLGMFQGLDAEGNLIAGDATINFRS